MSRLFDKTKGREYTPKTLPNISNSLNGISVTHNSQHASYPRKVYNEKVKELEERQKHLVQIQRNRPSNNTGLQNKFNTLTKNMKNLYKKRPIIKTLKHSGGGKRRTHRRKRV